MKKLLTVVLVITLALWLTACAAIPLLLVSDTEDTESETNVTFLEESDESTAVVNETIEPSKATSSEAESSQATSSAVASSETTSSKAESSKTTSSKGTSSKTASSKVVSSDTAEDPSADGNVYRTPHGKRYHLDPNCGGKNSHQTTYNQAISAGLTPCQKCAQ